MTYVVTQPCCNDASCVAVCPVNCIHPTPDERDYSRTEMLYIDPNTCIDCGACADACPIDAIVPDYDLEEGTERYLEINADYFEDPKHRDYPSAPVVQQRPVVGVTDATPLRVAIIGTGPAACYAGEEVLGSGAPASRCISSSACPHPGDWCGSVSHQITSRPSPSPTPSPGSGLAAAPISTSTWRSASTSPTRNS